MINVYWNSHISNHYTLTLCSPSIKLLYFALRASDCHNDNCDILQWQLKKVEENILWIETVKTRDNS